MRSLAEPSKVKKERLPDAVLEQFCSLQQMRPMLELPRTQPKITHLCISSTSSYLWLVGKGGMGYNYNYYYYHSSIPY